MRFSALATDYDGTIAWHGAVSESTRQALEHFKSCGGKVILVTGREIAELKLIFSPLTLFDIIVAENGALLYRPEKEEVQCLAVAPPSEFADALRERAVTPLSVGHVIVATQEIFSGVIHEVIQEMGLPLQMIPNKGSLMILPRHVDKASGLRAALAEIGITESQVVGVGDGENDYAFLSICGRSAAVANAVPGLKSQVDIVTRHDHGTGVEELISRMLSDNLGAASPRLVQEQLIPDKTE